MPEFLIYTGETLGFITNGTTHFVPQVGYSNPPFTNTEAHHQQRATDSYTMDQMFIFLISNGISDGSTIFVQRVNGADGNQTISVPASTSGTFSDTTNNDSIVANDLLNHCITAGGTTGSILARWMSHVIDGDQAPHQASGLDSKGTSADTFLIVSGALNADNEAGMEITVREATTFDGLDVFVTVNGISDPSTIKFRVDGSDGNQVATITASTTGRFQDTTNNDVVLVDSNVAYRYETGMGSHTDTSVTIVMVCCNGAGTKRFINNGGEQQVQQSANTVRYSAPEGRLSTNTIELEFRAEIRATQTIDHLRVQCKGFSLDVNGSVSVNINGTASSLTVTVTATGHFTDTSNNESVVSGDDLGYVVDSTASSTGNFFFDKATMNAGSPTDEVLAYGFWF